LPNSRVRTQIVKEREMMITPIQNACNMICDKNDDLRALIKKYDDVAPGTGPSVQPLAMALNGCIMAAVNGGLTMYQEAFLTEAFRQEEPEQAVYQKTLLAGINEQMIILDQGLQTFERHCTHDMTDLLGLLKEKFDQMCATWTDQGGPSESPSSPSSANIPPQSADTPTPVSSEQTQQQQQQQQQQTEGEQQQQQPIQQPQPPQIGDEKVQSEEQQSQQPPALMVQVQQQEQSQQLPAIITETQLPISPIQEQPPQPSQPIQPIQPVQPVQTPQLGQLPPLPVVDDGFDIPPPSIAPPP